MLFCLAVVWKMYSLLKLSNYNFDPLHTFGSPAAHQEYENKNSRTATRISRDMKSRMKFDFMSFHDQLVGFPSPASYFQTLCIVWKEHEIFPASSLWLILLLNYAKMCFPSLESGSTIQHTLTFLYAIRNLVNLRHILRRYVGIWYRAHLMYFRQPRAALNNDDDRQSHEKINQHLWFDSFEHSFIFPHNIYFVLSSSTSRKRRQKKDGNWLDCQHFDLIN